MPADERIKIIFKRVYVRNDADNVGSGEFYFVARVRGQPVGDPRRIYNAEEGRHIDLDEGQWSTIVNVLNTAEVEVSFQGKDEDPLVDDDLGTIRHTLRRPYTQRPFRHSTRHFILDWEVQLSVGGAFGRHPVNSVFACRQNTGSVTCTTVSGTSFPARMEIHPVRPVPAPPPASVLPVRPVFPAGTAAENTNARNTLVYANSPINIIPNPPVIPILGPPTAAPRRALQPGEMDEADWANLRNCARIEYTYYRPGTLNFSNDDRRLEWRIVSIGGGAASFLVQGLGGGLASSPTTRGLKVLVFGTTAGEVRLECRFQGALFATYRALVLNLRRIPCRINILNGSTADSIPRATPEQARDHLAIANRFLRQAAVELTLDTDPTRRDGARAVPGIPGIFRIPVARNRTRDLRLQGTERATLMNYRPNVMNFAYIHSDHDGNLGAATDFPASTAGAVAGVVPVTAGRPVVQDTGTPSTSWVRPTGVGIGADATAGPVNMSLIEARQRAGHPQLFAMYVTDVCGGARLPVNNHNTVARQREYANTIAHEFGHILNLGHRVEGVEATQADMVAGTPVANLSAGGIFWDGLLQPPHENLMQWHDPSVLAQDIDIIQARAIHLSPLVTAATAVQPAVPPAPPRPRPRPRRTGGGNGRSTDYTIVPGDYLSRIAERYGMSWQELYNYDGGTGTANRSRLRSGDPDVIYPGEVIRVPAEHA